MHHCMEYSKSSDDFIDVWYFSKILNVGDLIGPYLLEKLSGKKARKNIFGVRPHYLSVGSILDQVTEKSNVWGSGFLKKSDELRYEPEKLSLVRGKLTKNKLPSKYNPALGDPALALSQFYTPQISRIKKWKMGLVLHYSDEHLEPLFSQQKEVKIIKISQGVESFIDQITSCEVVFSSSLHGLIVSDAYQVNNCWIKFSSCERKDDFKYHDYFSIFSDKTPDKACLIKIKKPILLSTLIPLCNTRSIEKHVHEIVNSFDLND